MLGLSVTNLKLRDYWQIEGFVSIYYKSWIEIFTKNCLKLHNLKDLKIFNSVITFKDGCMFCVVKGVVSRNEHLEKPRYASHLANLCQNLFTLRWKFAISSLCLVRPQVFRKNFASRQNIKDAVVLGWDRQVFLFGCGFKFFFFLAGKCHPYVSQVPSLVSNLRHCSWRLSIYVLFCFVLILLDYYFELSFGIKPIVLTMNTTTKL